MVRRLVLILKNRTRLVVAVICLFVSLLGFIYLLPRNSRRPSYSGLDLLHDCSAETDGFITLQLQKDSPDIIVSIKVQDWERVSKDCKSLEFHFPGRTTNHAHFINLQSWDDPRIGVPGAGLKPLRDATITHDNLLDQDIIQVDPSKLKEYRGDISFTWIDGLQKIGFGRYKVFLQFGATKTPGLNLKHTSHFKLNLLAPSNFELASQTPSATASKAFGQASFYWFDIESPKTVLTLTFEDEDKVRAKEFLLILFATVFGIGCTLFIEEAISFTRFRQVEPRIEGVKSQSMKNSSEPVKPKQRKGKRRR